MSHRMGVGVGIAWMEMRLASGVFVVYSSDDEDHTFEFISNYKNNVVLPLENILFCGKLIPYKNNNPILSSSMSKK
ncbi:hypothetical protein H5410_040128 [Solanum commersonii]|uniref:Uncharacterized protein n=1 Tax=Solanum commersonii TaxID=4109 RepID=A0A9J5XRL4_SOLCO|nr:hypothetical protein H5410_040128 [Solanum commersonii]